MAGGGGAFDSIVGMIGIDIYYITETMHNYQATASRDNMTATFTVTVTETSVTDGYGNSVENGEIRSSRSVSISKYKGNFSSESKSQIETIAIASVKAALAKGVEVGVWLGIVQGESEFGQAKASDSKDPVSNPSQFSGRRAQKAAWKTDGYAAALKYNLETSIDEVFFYAKELATKNSMGHSVLWATLYHYNGSTKIRNGIEERVAYANRVEPIINGIRASASTNTFRTGWFFFTGVPKSLPIFIMPCPPTRPC